MACCGPKPLVLAGPSGSGKSTLVKRLLKEYPDKLGFSVSHTTRQPRPGEKDGVDYHFTTVDKMDADIAAGKFIESASFSGNKYGTSKTAIETVRKEGKVCVLDIDIQGVKTLKGSNLNPWYIFVQPPDLNTLENRLRSRDTETDEILNERLQIAAKEIEYAKAPGNFDVVIVNDDLDEAYAELKKFVQVKVLKKCKK